MGAAVPAIMAGTAIYGAIQGRDAQKKADKETERAKRESDQQNAAYQAKIESDRRKKASMAMSTRKSLLAGARGGGNRGGTLLTGPSGLKTSLGA